MEYQLWGLRNCAKNLEPPLPAAGAEDGAAAREMGCKDSEAIATAGGAGELMGCPSIYEIGRAHV